MSLSKKQKAWWRAFFQGLRDKGLVGICLTILLSVDLVLNAVSMSVLAPGDMERVGFIAVGVIIVALGVPAYLRDFKGLWLTFAILSAFLNTSFILESSRVQSETITVASDAEIKRLDTLAEKKEGELTDWQKQYSGAVAGSNMDRISTQMNQIRDELQNIYLDRKERYAIIESGGARKVVTGDAVFTAIPTAAGIENFPAAVIKLLFFGALFFGVQRAIVIFAKGGHRKQKVETVKVNFGKPKKISALPDEIVFDDQTPFTEKPFDDGLTNEERIEKLAPGFGSRELG